MQHRIVTPGPLHDGNGHLTETGYATELIKTFGADSLVGRTAAVMLGSSETTLYVAAVYFSAAGVKDSRWAIPAALCADLVCFLSSAWLCRLLKKLGEKYHEESICQRTLA